jgi:MinD-like ATPase involved in chromosome partitioning or flagellar assembly
VVITVYADRRIHDVTAVAESLADAVAEIIRPTKVFLYIDRVANGERARRKRAPLRRALPANPVSALSTAAESADVTILGVWGPVTEHVITAFDLSRVVLLLTDDAVTSLRAAQRTLKLCAGLGYGADRVVVVRLLDSSETSLDGREVAIALKREIFASVSMAGSEAEYQRLAAKLFGSR